jgi:hypothetical protein
MIDCEKCKFWKRTEHYDEWGACHRHAPSPVVQLKTGFDAGSGEFWDQEYGTLWPITFISDGCGEGELASADEAETK